MEAFVKLRSPQPIAAGHGSHGLILCFVSTRSDLHGVSPRQAGLTCLLPDSAELGLEIPERDSHLAADYGQLTENLRRFYDFSGKVVLFVGAGGRQLLDPSVRTRKLIAIDQDVESLMELKTNVATGMRGSVVVVVSS